MPQEIKLMKFAYGVIIKGIDFALEWIEHWPKVFLGAREMDG